MKIILLALISLISVSCALKSREPASERSPASTPVAVPGLTIPKNECRGIIYTENAKNELQFVITKFKISKDKNDKTVLAMNFDDAYGTTVTIPSGAESPMVLADLDLGNHVVTKLKFKVRKSEQENGDFMLISGTTSRSDINKGKPSNLSGIMECNLN